jgi:hypothetical protein
MPGLGKKTFTAGDVLIAGDVNNYLMDQTVMNFATTAARSSAIPVPSTGMVSYVGTTGTAIIPQIETYTGSAWQTPYGMTLVANGVLSGQSSILFDNVFTSAYRNYKIIVSISTSSGTAGITAQMRTSGSAVGSSTYQTLNLFSDLSSGPTRSGSSGNTSCGLGATYGVYYGADLTVLNPQIFSPTQMIGSIVNFRPSPSLIEQGLTSQNFDANNIFDGIGFSAAGGITLTGSVRIYGYRNS